MKAERFVKTLTEEGVDAFFGVPDSLLKHHRALEVDSRLLPFKKIITLIDS